MMIAEGLGINAIGEFRIRHALADETLRRLGVIFPLLFFSFAIHADRLVVECGKNTRVRRTEFFIANRAVGGAGNGFFPVFCQF